MWIPIFLSLLWLALVCLPGCAVFSQDSSGVRGQEKQPTAVEFQNQRLQMVERQIRRRGIENETVLTAISKVPRHRFVDPVVAHLAYGDFPLPIGHDQTISQPYIVAYMTDVAEISSQEKVLEIGTGSGYQAAILGELAKEVYTIEIIPELAAKASQTLQELGYTNVHVKAGDGYQGWPEHAPYDAIVVTAAPNQIPEPLVKQLAVNGKMIIPVGTWYQDMMILTKTTDGVLQERTIPVRFVPLTRTPNK